MGCPHPGRHLPSAFQRAVARIYRTCRNRVVRAALARSPRLVCAADRHEFAWRGREIRGDLHSGVFHAQAGAVVFCGSACVSGDCQHHPRQLGAGSPWAGRVPLNPALLPSTSAALGLTMFAGTFALLMLGFPVAFTLVGTALFMAAIGSLLGVFDFHLLSALPLRVIGLMENDLLQAVPLFLYFGLVLERTTLAADLLEGISSLFGRR